VPEKVKIQMLLGFVSYVGEGFVRSTFSMRKLLYGKEIIR
jgi:hypothetical protein